MTHADKGHFSGKHPPGTTVEPRIAQVVENRLRDGVISCTAAHATAAELGVDPMEIGIAIDLQDGRIEKCQLGLFGHPGGKRVTIPETVDRILADTIAQTASDSRLACADAWDIAAKIKKTRREVADTCEALNIRIVNCQLGAFRRSGV